MSRKLRAVRLIAGLVAAYVAVLCFPQPFFVHSVSANGLTLYSDRPLPDAAARDLLHRSSEKLAQSPLFREHPGGRAFLCNSRWRQRLFFNRDYGVAGVSPYPLTTNVFLRDASVTDNRLISPRGIPVPGSRTLDYFVAHELTHQLTGRVLGPLGFYRLPKWVREGYADYVGKGSAFDYAAARRALLDGAPEMDWQHSGLYLRFHLQVAHLLDHRHWTVDRLLHGPWPDPATIDSEIRAGG